MALPIGVYKRGAVFHIQIKVPADLKHAWPTPFYARRSLGTEDRAEATAQGHRLWADATEAFARARATLKPAQVTELTPALIDAICTQVHRQILANDDDMRSRYSGILSFLHDTMPTQPHGKPWVTPEYLWPSEDGEMTPAQLERLREVETVMVAGLKDEIAFNRTALGKQYAGAALAAFGFQADLDDPAHRPAMLRVTRSVIDAAIKATGRSRGEVVETPAPSEMRAEVSAPAATLKKAKDAPRHLRDMVADWKAAKRPTDDSIQRTERALRHLEASGQDLPLTNLKRPHGAALRAWLLHDDRDFASKTALNYWQALGALMNVARDVGAIDLNPWQGMGFEVKGSKKRNPFTDEELRRLFGTTLHTHGTWPVVQKVERWDAYFCMLLLLWTGARVGELAQLELSDVLRQNGVEVFSINEEAEGSTVKTDDSVRVLPVPPELIRLGFLDRVASLRERGESKVFPSFHRPGAVTPGEIMSEWFRPFRSDIGAATGALNGTHRFRHTIRTRLNALGIPEATADALTGHASQGSAGRRIYTQPRPEDVREALERIQWPVEFHRVYPMSSKP